MAKKNLIVAHGDLDGIICAALAVRQVGMPAQIIFVQPFTVDKVEIPEDIEEIWVFDVAVNNRDPQMTEDFIRRIGDRLVRWYDHHIGWSILWPTLANPRLFTIDERAGSCAELVTAGLTMYANLVADATVADTRKGVLSWGAQLIEQATKANMADDNIRLLAVKWLLGDELAREGLEEAAKKYAEIQTETERLAATYQVTGKVVLVDARQSNHQYDLTQLLLAGQKLARFAVVLTVHPLQGEGLTIATSSGVNLVELFHLGSGAPFRVSLPAKRLEEALAKLETV